MTVSTPLLEVADLRVRLEHAGRTTHVIEGVSLRVAEGESVGIAGESGSGKSLLARTLMGLRPRGVTVGIEGSVRFDGQELVTQGHHAWSTAGRSMAMIFQDPSSTLNPVVRVGNQITEAAPEATRRSPRRRRALAIELLRAVQVPEPERAAHRFPGQLSGGQRQRVGVAAALASGPRLLLADEPTTALDATIQQRVLDLIDELRRERGLALVHISHDLAVLAGQTDRVIVMYAGRIVEDGPSRAVLTAPAHPYTRALLESTPRLRAPRRPPLPQIPGTLPDLAQPRVGCSFAPRCPVAQSICHTARPPHTPAGPARTAACWFPLATSSMEVPA